MRKNLMIRTIQAELFKKKIQDWTIPKMMEVARREEMEERLRVNKRSLLKQSLSKDPSIGPNTFGDKRNVAFKGSNLEFDRSESPDRTSFHQASRLNEIRDCQPQALGD